jgi:hypothetical protein
MRALALQLSGVWALRGTLTNATSTARQITNYPWSNIFFLHLYNDQTAKFNDFCVPVMSRVNLLDSKCRLFQAGTCLSQMHPALISLVTWIWRTTFMRFLPAEHEWKYGS